MAAYAADCRTLDVISSEELNRMSGISGIFYLDGRPVQDREILAVTNAMRHRGPDGSAVWTQGVVALGHNLFKTTPESNFDRQPLWSEQDMLAITCDARIDNRDELIELLAIRHPHAEVPDSEIILRSYATWGEDRPKRLVGDFSFAIWDKRTESLFCARDRFGVKPFCYCFLPGRFFAFATQIKALLELPVPRRLNEWLIAGLVEPTFVGFEQTATFYKDILKCKQPASSLMCAKRVERSDIGADLEGDWQFLSDDEYLEVFGQLFCSCSLLYEIGG